jgi:hypothetical protein
VRRGGPAARPHARRRGVCPLGNDGLAILSRLRYDHPEMTFGAIRDGRQDDPQQDKAYGIWESLDADAGALVTSEFDVTRFATTLGLTPSTCVPAGRLGGNK